MWKEVVRLIERFLRCQELTPESVKDVLGVDLALRRSTGYLDHYQASIPSGPFREVELRVVPETGKAILVLDADVDHPIVVTPGDLELFGPCMHRSIEPESPPEGKVGEGFTLRGMELWIGYRAKSCILETVSLRTS